MVHVPYHGGAPALAAMMANQVQVMFSPLPESIAAIKAGKVRALAVTSLKRAEELPDTPAVAETVHGFEAVSWNGIGAPKKTPADIVAKLNKEINASLADPAIKARLTQLGGTPSPLSTADFEKFIVSETRKWGDVVHKAGITVQ
jgi:tripartite-type tricarboxylate transporter receptor subunit TctC